MLARVARSALLLAGLGAADRLEAQAWAYPALQLPRASDRDYTAALAGGAGSTLLFQWREGVGTGMHLGLDVGLADSRGSSNLLGFVGGSVGYELLRSAGEQPLDVLLSGGVGLAVGGGTSLFRVPVGVSVGHTFELEQGMALTPFVHPRLSIDLCADCGPRDRSRSELSLNFDLGADFRVNRRFSVRVAGSFSGSDLFYDDDTFAVGFNWRPASLRR